MCVLNNGILEDTTPQGEEREVWPYQREGGNLASQMILVKLVPVALMKGLTRPVFLSISVSIEVEGEELRKTWCGVGSEERNVYQDSKTLHGLLPNILLPFPKWPTPASPHPTPRNNKKEGKWPHLSQLWSKFHSSEASDGTWALIKLSLSWSVNKLKLRASTSSGSRPQLQFYHLRKGVIKLLICLIVSFFCAMFPWKSST